MPPRRLDCRAITYILEKVRSDFRSEMELMKNDTVVEIVRAIVGVLRNMGIEDGHEEVAEDFEIAGSSCEDRTDQIERFVEDRTGQLDRYGARLKLKHKMDVFNFSGILNLEDLIDWIDELEDYSVLEDIGDPLRVRLAQSKLKSHTAL